MRDELILSISEKEVSVNVHFQPLPLLTAYNKRGYRMEDYPVSFAHYEHELSLPVYFDLNDEMLDTVIDAVCKSVDELV
jgi:dTDP-4-amino-4,6-dideoxygalactose transaminase